MEKIKVGIVNYLNTKPLLFGLEREAVKENIELIQDYPSHIAQYLLDNSIDIGLVPVAVIPRLKEYHIVSSACIGAVGPVASVCLLSKVPLADIKYILLDYQSRTSVNLLKVLVKFHWNLNVTFIDTNEDFVDRIEGDTAGLLIGDRCLQNRSKFPFVFDLAETWIEMTGLPFVFAAWVSNKPLPETFIADFNHANKLGLEHIDQVVAATSYAHYDALTYFTKNISYDLTEKKRKGLALFLEYLLKL
ncbi:MAG: menaquinone biosynthesis protein [Chitinophagaceae bacterium]|uniref:menaquinone biosynthetic enzyme MqnA/MqnD family protein n=1 Tax=unclassified Paraflavitalea TaxID=2798305 RepID=UPI003D333423|nr:menaquinone biosynthesis protein [Chitinophagaceae bacterium]